MITALVNLAELNQFIYEGDIFGFFQAIYTSAFGSADIFYAFLSILIVLPIYIRTKSLIFCAIAWIMLGSFFIIASPLVSGIAILLVLMGLSSLLYKLVMRVRG